MSRKYTLFVDKSKPSNEAKKLCENSLDGDIEIVDVSDIYEPPSIQPRPRLLAPEGRFVCLEGIKKYISHYGKSSNKTPITESSDLWIILPVL